VEGDVVRSRVQGFGIVPELAETAVAVETQEGSDGTGRMIVIDVPCGSRLADRAQTLLLLQQIIGLIGADSIPSGQVVGAITTTFVRIGAASNGMTGQAVTPVPSATRPRLHELVERLDLCAVPTPLVSDRDHQRCRRLALNARLASPRFAASQGTFSKMFATVKRKSIATSRIP
jgi:hypothetical protein